MLCILDGIEHCGNQFFVQQIPVDLLDNWKKLSVDKPVDDDLGGSPSASDGSNVMLHPDRLTNPLLNHKLQNILDDQHSNVETRQMLLHLLAIARFVMNAGIPVKRVMELGVFLRQSGPKVDYAMLGRWVAQLKLEQMTQLTGVMLIRLMGFGADELPLMKPTTPERMDEQIREMFRQKNSHAEQWYFSQGKDIFVHTSNSSAMLWHVRRSAKYLRYYPSEAVTNFFTSFAHSLSHIEE